MKAEAKGLVIQRGNDKHLFAYYVFDGGEVRVSSNLKSRLKEDIRIKYGDDWEIIRYKAVNWTMR